MIVRILAESFRTLFRKPEVFAPKLASTLSASLFLVYLLSNRTALSAMDPSLFLSGMTAVVLVLSIMGVYSSMMLSSMVKDSIGLKEAFMRVGKRSRPILAVSAGVLLLGGVLAAIVSFGYYFSLVTGSYSFLAWAAITAFFLMFAASYIIYFLPITMLEEKSLSGAIRSSRLASGKNKAVVTSLLIFSFALITLAVFSTGYLEKLGYVGFVVGRLVSAVINTYLFIVSPTYYLESGSGSENLD